MNLLLKTYAGVNFSRVNFYDPLPKFAVETALWRLKPDNRDPTFHPFQGFSIGTFGSRVRRQK